MARRCKGRKRGKGHLTHERLQAMNKRVRDSQYKLFLFTFLVLAAWGSILVEQLLALNIKSSITLTKSSEQV